MLEKNLMFVSVVQDPFLRGSSTQILNENLISGFHENGYHIYFIAIYENDDDINNIIKYYSKYVKAIIPVKSYMNVASISHKKYRVLLQILKGYIFYRRYMKVIPENTQLEKDSFHDMVLLSHTPSLEAAFLCKSLIKQYKFKEYIQFWGDPYALSGIYLENFNIKRLPSYYIEKSLIKIADSVVYPGRPLFSAQSKLYKKFSHKMRCVDFSYSCKSSTQNDEIEQTGNKLLFGYLGNYMSNVRNIKPLFDAFSTDIDAKLIVCGTGDVTPENNENIIVKKRLPQSQIVDLEAKINVFISIINHSCLQIPGKIFYQSNRNKIILIILDGKYKNEMYEYLSKFNRFEFCENNKESITSAIRKICSGECKVDLSCLDVLSPKYVSESILKTK